MPDPCGAWALSPSELAPQFTGAPASLFAALQRPWLWSAGRPVLGRRAAAHVEMLGAALPTVVERRRSSDGSHKLVLEWPEHRDRVEVVHMPRAVRGGRV